MKSNTHYVLAFGNWLHTLGYSPSRVQSMPRMLQEYCTWLHTQQITQIVNSTEVHVQQFMAHTSKRPNNRQEGSITASYINQYITVFYKFNEYLAHHKLPLLPLALTRLAPPVLVKRVVLTVDEIKAMYQATDQTPLGMRNRAMLAIYYGGGLRRSEGVQLTLSDVLIERKLLVIRKSKNNTQRYTPINTSTLAHITNYIYNARPLLVHPNSTTQALLLSERGKGISTTRVSQCIKEIGGKAGITKEVGTHSLRHSIATHLLQSGMALENIALFLGHKCLDSTQIYTHLSHEL